MVKLYLAVPCYNEEEVLYDTTEKLTKKYDQMINDGLITSEENQTNPLSEIKGRMPEGYEDKGFGLQRDGRHSRFRHRIDVCGFYEGVQRSGWTI